MAVKYVIVQWKNKYSGETGYVKKIDYKNRCFINAEESKNAKKFKYEAKDEIIPLLTEYGESESNDFTIIELK